MWNPGFAFEEKPTRLSSDIADRFASVPGSTGERKPAPGLVLGLDRGGACRGMAFRVAEHEREDVLAYLRERELVTNVYLERLSPIRLSDGRRVTAVTYVVDRDHRQYAGSLDDVSAAHVVNGASGHSGPNDAYVFNTLAHLKELGIRDHWLEQVTDEIERMRQAS